MGGKLGIREITIGRIMIKPMKQRGVDPAEIKGCGNRRAQNRIFEKRATRVQHKTISGFGALMGLTRLLIRPSFSSFHSRLGPFGGIGFAPDVERARFERL